MLMLPPLAAATCTERKNVQILPVLECVLLLLLLPLGRRLESIQRGGLVAESSKHALAQRADLRLPRAQLGGEQPVPQRVRVRVVQATTPERRRECRHCDARDDAIESLVSVPSWRWFHPQSGHTRSVCVQSSKFGALSLRASLLSASRARPAEARERVLAVQ